MSKLLEKKKIEEIAKNFIKKQKSYKNIHTINQINYNKKDNNGHLSSIQGKNNNAEETMKDSFYNITNQKLNNINIKISQLKGNDSFCGKNQKNIKKNKQNDNLKFYSTVNNSLTDYYYYCCKKNVEARSSQIEDDINNIDINQIGKDINQIDNNINQINDNDKEIKDNKQNNNIDNKSENDDNLDNDKDISNIYSLECNNDNSFNDENILDSFNKIIIVYKDLMNDFANKTLKEKRDHFQSQVLSCHYLKFLLSDNLLLFLKYFNNSIDVMKFIIYQIFIFLTIIYIDENKELNECSEMAYRTIFLYSSQNYELLLNIIKKIINPSEPKTQKSLRSKNKIIISILKTLIPKKITENSSINNYTDFNSLNNDNIPNISINLIEEIEYETKFNRTNESKIIISNKLKKFLQNLKINEQLMNKINEIEKKEIELKSQINQNNNNIELIEEKNNNKKKLYLPNVDKNKYKYTLFIELDETLVHYYEDGNNYFVKVRCGTEDFIKTMSEFCEIIIVSTSNKEYTDIIIKNLNKDKCYVNQTIYKEMFDDNNEILDFSLINRDMSKCIFICHEDEFFNAPKNNIVKLKEFLGEANDREIIYLHLELMKLSVNNVDNVTNIIKDIIQFIKNKREEK
jgi:hypothetical protein